MTTQSHEQPVLVEHIGGAYRINFNVEEKVREDMNGSHTYYEYYTAVSPTLNRDDVITAIIRCKYSADAEFALLNNFNQGGETYEAEYEAYQAFRGEAKALADTVING